MLVLLQTKVCHGNVAQQANLRLVVAATVPLLGDEKRLLRTAPVSARRQTLATLDSADRPR